MEHIEETNAKFWYQILVKVHIYSRSCLYIWKTKIACRRRSYQKRKMSQKGPLAMIRTRFS